MGSVAAAAAPFTGAAPFVGTAAVTGAAAPLVPLLTAPFGAAPFDPFDDCLCCGCSRLNRPFLRMTAGPAGSAWTILKRDAGALSSPDESLRSFVGSTVLGGMVPCEDSLMLHHDQQASKQASNE